MSESIFEKIQITYSKRKTISIQVKNGQVFLKAPYLTPKFFIRDLVQKKQSWIEQKIIISKEIHEQKQFSKAQDPSLILFYKQELTKYLRYKLPIYADLVGVGFKKISIRSTRSRWGSCSSQGNLSFSAFLWNTPEYVIDYVIVHELCHLRYMNHSKDFWNLVSINYPQYKLAESWLKTKGKTVM